MQLWDKTAWMPAPQRVGAVLWISFLVAAAATGALFSAIDPEDVRQCLEWPKLSRLGAYTIGFLALWTLGASTALMAVFFVYPPAPGGPPTSLQRSHE